MYAIGIDIGTTTICGILLNLKTGAVEQTETRPNCAALPSEHPWERLQSPISILQTADAVLESLWRPKTAAVGISNQMHGIVYLSESGHPVSPFYTWQDEHGNLPYHGTTYASFLGSASGFGNVTDFALSDMGQLPEAPVFCSIGDLLALHLTGKNMPLTHCSNAASFGLFDLQNNRFTNPTPRQPAVTSAPDIVGIWRDIPVCVAIGDNQASFMGSVFDPHGALVNIGTGSQISFRSDTVDCPPTMEARPYLEGGQYLWAGSALCGGRAYAMLERFFEAVVRLAGFEPPALYTAMGNALNGNPLTRTLRFQNQFCGTRQDPTRRGRIENISIDDFTPENFLIGTLYGIADELHEMCGGLPVSCRTLVASGNGLRRNPALQHIVGEVFGLPPAIPAHREEAAYGAALFASVGCGCFSSLQDAQSLIQYK